MNGLKNYILASYIMIANFLDAVWTHRAIRKNEIQELNPIMAFLLERQDYSFYIVKIVVVSLALLLLLRLQDKTKTHRAMAFVALIYTIVLGLHVRGHFS